MNILSNLDCLTFYFNESKLGEEEHNLLFIEANQKIFKFIFNQITDDNIFVKKLNILRIINKEITVNRNDFNELSIFLNELYFAEDHDEYKLKIFSDTLVKPIKMQIIRHPIIIYISNRWVDI